MYVPTSCCWLCVVACYYYYIFLHACVHVLFALWLSDWSHNCLLSGSTSRRLDTRFVCICNFISVRQHMLLVIYYLHKNPHTSNIHAYIPCTCIHALHCYKYHRLSALLPAIIIATATNRNHFTFIQVESQIISLLLAIYVYFYTITL